MAANAHFTGWLPQPHDPVDNMYHPPSQPGDDRKVVDLSTVDKKQDGPYNQLFLGSCVANAIAAALRFGENARYKNNWHAHYDPSRLWLYWCGRVGSAVGEPVTAAQVQQYIQNWYSDSQGIPRSKGQGLISFSAITEQVRKDSGCFSRDVIRALVNIGVCKDEVWSYQDVQSHVNNFPGGMTGAYASALSQLYCGDAKYFCPKETCIDEARKYIDPEFTFYRIADLVEPDTKLPNPNLSVHMESALKEGYPVILGLRFGSTKGFNVDPTNHVYGGTVANDTEELHGHCVLCVGYDSNKQLFKFLNSWGSDWGDKGYFYVPYKLFTNPDGTFTYRGNTLPYADDIWVAKAGKSQK